MRRFRKIVSIFLVLCMCLSLSSICFAAEDSTPVYRAISDAEYYSTDYTGYRYPVRPGTAEWASLENHQDKVDACQIPEDILSSMSTEELVQTVIAYPLNIDMFAYDNTTTGFEVVASHFNGLQELQSRSDSVSELIDLYLETPLARTSTLSDESFLSFDDLVIPLLLRQESIYEDATPENRAVLSQVAVDEKASSSVSAASSLVLVGYESYSTGTSTIRTPKNSSVTVYKMAAVEVLMDTSTGGYYYGNTLSDFPSSYKTTLNNETEEVYGISPIADPTVKYNCHSYAWYQQSTSNPYWLNYPDKFITDGSYTKVSKLEVEIGGRMVYYDTIFDTYGTPTHSAIITGIVDRVHSVREFTVKSKWGMLGLYEHSWINCPYYYVNLTPVDLEYYN